MIRKALLAALLVFAGSRTAVAGTTSIINNPAGIPITYAQETCFAAPDNLRALPLGSLIRRVSTIIPNDSILGVSDTVVVEINLLDNTSWSSIVNIAANALTITGFPNCASTTTPALVSGTQIRFKVVFSGFGPGGTCGASGTFSFNPTNNGGDQNRVVDTAGLLVNGGTIRVQMRTLDGASVPTDTGGVDTVPFLTSALATSGSVVSTTALIDVGLPSARKNFVAGGGDTLTQDGGGFVLFGFAPFNNPQRRDCRLGPNPFVPGLFTNGFRACPSYASDGFNGDGCFSEGFYTMTFGGDFTGVASIVFNPAGNFGQLPNAATINGSTATIRLSPIESYRFSSYGIVQGNGAPQPTVINVTGTTVLTPRTISVNSMTYTDQISGTVRNTPIASVQTFTVWTFNGSVLFAPFVNGNTNQFKSRVYVCVPQSSGVTGATIKILKQPVAGSSGTALATVTTTEPIADLGCLNFRVEDILTSGGIAQPYTADGGNLALEFTVNATKAVGTVNVINFQPSTGPESIATYDMFREQ